VLVQGRARLTALLVAAAVGCSYTAPALTTPPVVQPESASRLVMLVKTDLDPKLTLGAEAMSRLTSVMNAIAAELGKAAACMEASARSRPRGSSGPTSSSPARSRGSEAPSSSR
jgi:hypothetical protein